jgi:hypothetical protein
MTRSARVLLGVAPILALSAATITFAGGSPGKHDDNEPDRGQSRVQRGFALAPVPLDLHGKNRDLVGMGSYIVNAQGACNDCHTCPPYTPASDPYTGGDGHPNAANYLAGGTPFGPFVSKNITPDENGYPAGLTRDEFIQLMRTGHDPDDAGQVLQVMPWPVYGKMLTRDLKAVYEYLSAIPHAETSAECAAPPPPTR